MGLSCLQPTYSFSATGDTQHPDSNHITESGNGDHTGIVIAIFC